MFKVIPMIFQHITTELNGAKPEEDRTKAITKTVLNYRITVNTVLCDSICRYLLPLHISVS
jgi:hypothetical protein